MRLSDYLSVANVTFQTNRLRTLLTVFELAIGIAALIIAFEIRAGVNKTVNEVITGFEGKYMMVSPCQDQASQQPKVKNFDMDDARAISGIPGITLISLQKTTGLIPIRYFNWRIQTDIYGTDPNYFVIRNRTVVKGRFINISDLRNERWVCVITEEIRRAFFSAGGYLGRKLEINGVVFEIIGCLRPVRLPAPFNQKNNKEGQIFVPLTTWQSLLKQYDFDHLWFCYSDDYKGKREIKLLKGRILRILNYRHDTTEAFTITTLDDFLKEPKKQTYKVLGSLYGLAVLCFLVGGVGIRRIVIEREKITKGDLI